MGETKELPVSIIRYEGIYDWKELYHLVGGWLRGKKYDFFENKNIHKPVNYGYEFEYGATAEREETDYVKFVMEVKIRGVHAEDIEIIEKGEKKQKTKVVLMTIQIIPKVEFDWRDDSFFESTPFKKNVRKFLHKYIMKHDVEKWTDKLYYEAYQFQTKIRECLDLEHKHNAYAPWHTTK